MAAWHPFSSRVALPLQAGNRGYFAHVICHASTLKKPSSSSRSGDIIPLKEGLEALVRAYRLQGKLNEVTVVSSWERVMGKAVALKTQEVYVNKGRLFVRLSSAPLKHELLMAKTRVAELINAEVGEKVVSEVIFL